MEIKDLNKYVREGLDKGEFSVGRYVKSSRIHAAPGVPGEQIDTILKNGLKETWNIVGIDSEDGTPDWIVTAPDGERYIVKDKTFREKYRPDPGEPGAFLPAGKPMEAVQVHENIRFVAPWGEEELLVAGGYLMLDPGGIYGVAADEFRKTYKRVED